MRTHLPPRVLGLLLVSLVPALAAEPPRCAGNVQVDVVSGKLFIIGDDEPNCINLNSDANREDEVGDFTRIGGEGDTTVNGVRHVFAQNVTGDALIRLGDGDDILNTSETLDFPRNLKIDTGDGDDHLHLLDLRALGRLVIETREGNDGLSTFSIGGRKGLSISMGDGDDAYFAWEEDGVGTKGSVSMGHGNDRIEASFYGDRVFVGTGSGDDTVRELNARTERLYLNLGSGNDVVQEIGFVAGASFEDTPSFTSGAALLHGGSGTDTLGTVWVSPAYPANVVARSFEDWKPE